MTHAEFDLSELLDALRAGDLSDPIRASLQWVLQALIEAEATEAIGAGPHERSTTRINQRNGHRLRVLSTQAGDVELKIPKLRHGSFFPSLLERRRRIDRALFAVALIALPLSGWMWSSVADKPIMMLGLVQLPPLVAPAPEYYGLAKLVHQWLSWTFGLVVLGHAAAALKHHFVDRDGVMASMLPGFMQRK